jgi:hypothetical protein
MGSHAQDSSTQKAASSGSQQQDQQLAQNAAKNQQFADQTRTSLFGPNGTESKFLDPNSMNRAGLDGSYLQNYNTEADAVSRNAKNAVGTTMQNLASRGIGKAPAGFAADQERKAYEDAAATKGSLYAGNAGAQHAEDVNNYWNATNMLNSNASQTANLSVQGNQAAAGNYASLYGTASQQAPSGWGTALGFAGSLANAGATAYAGR